MSIHFSDNELSTDGLLNCFLMNKIYSVDGGFNLPIYSFTSGILSVRLPWLDRKYVNFDQQDNSSNQFSYLVYKFQNSAQEFKQNRIFRSNRSNFIRGTSLAI